MPDSAIGVFDSGFGGLTVLKSLMKRLPEESFIYLGDCARLPYGTKSQETIRLYLEQNITYLDQMNVKAIVIACNSASSALKADDDFGIPVFNVIDPGTTEAIKATQNKKVGVIGTRATVSQNSYKKKLTELNSNIEVSQVACPLFVSLVEEGWHDDPLTNLVIHRYLQPLLQTDIDTLILGCTHYPVLKEAIQKITRSKVTLIDSAEAIAEQVAASLDNAEIEKNNADEATLSILSSDVGAFFQEVATRILSPIPAPKIHHVHISP